MDSIQDSHTAQTKKKEIKTNFCVVAVIDRDAK